MFPYLVVFASCAAFSALGCAYENKSRFLFYVSSGAVVLILVLFAALRAQCVGTDTSGYAISLYNLALASDSFMDFYTSDWLRTWGWSSVSTIEIGYLLFVWIASKLGSPQVLLFLTSLFTVGPIYIALVLRRREIAPPVSLFVFMLLYFNVTLNAMRQWIALSLLFLALIGLHDKDKTLHSQPLVYILLIIAAFFHASAVLGFLLLLVMRFMQCENSRLRIAIFPIFAIALLAGVGVLRVLLISFGLVRYANYLGDGTIGFSINQFILRLPFVFVAIELYRANVCDKRDASFYLTISLVGLILGQLATLTDQSGRITLLFDMYIIPAVGCLCGPSTMVNRFKRCLAFKASSSDLTLMASLLYCLVYWFYFYAIRNTGETIPYLFFWA